MVFSAKQCQREVCTLKQLLYVETHKDINRPTTGVAVVLGYWLPLRGVVEDCPYLSPCWDFDLYKINMCLVTMSLQLVK